MEWASDDYVALQGAKRLLSHPGLAVRIANAVGTPIEKLFAMLPEGAADTIRTVTTKSLNGAVRLATSRMDEEPRRASARLHTLAVAATGAVGGAFGFAALAAELPASTAIMMRSIADIARSEGHSIRSPRIQLACVEVFALGGPGSGDDGAESGYFAVRAALAKAVTEAAEHLAARGLTTEAAPAIVGFVAKVAARFGIPVTEKVMAQSVPIIGAAGGAMLNILFIKHFQDMARGHFTVLRLEDKYGADAVKQAYAGLV